LVEATVTPTHIYGTRGEHANHLHHLCCFLLLVSIVQVL